MTIPVSLGEAWLVNENLLVNPIAQRTREGRFILYKNSVTLPKDTLAPDASAGVGTM